MLQPDFQNNPNTQFRHEAAHHQPKLRVQYSAGFRKLQTKSKRQKQKSQLAQSCLTCKQNGVIGYVDQLGIQNLTRLYSETIQDPTKLLMEQFKQQQDQSVVRLYKNLYPTRKSRVQENQIQQQEGKQNKKYASQIWNLDKKYEKQPPQYIIKKQLEKMHRKFQVQLNGILKKKKIEQSLSYQQIFACFLLQQWQNILKIRKDKNKSDVEVELFYQWKRFLSTTNFKNLIKKSLAKTISKQELQKLKLISKYLFCVITIPQVQQKQTKIGVKLFKLEQLKGLIRDKLQIPIQLIKVNFEVSKQYTNPYCIQYKNQPTKKIQVQSDEQQQIDNYKFKAVPVPKSTYVQPKQKNRPQPKTTIQKPFNITYEKGQKMTPEEYYHWQSDFKAQPVPTTTYKPHKPELLSKQQIKARAVMNLQKSKYPKTMQQLNSYKQNQNRKMQELTAKHIKQRYQQYHPHQIPNFDRLHAQQIVKFETIRQKNKKQVKVQPFHLSISKKRPIADTNNYTKSPQIHHYSPPSKPAMTSKSTKKFDAYVKYRAEEQNKRVRKQENEKIQQEKKQQKKKPYRQIIKNRMMEQFEAHPRIKSNYDSSLPQKIKVDKQKIYKQKPLLMESSLPAQEYVLSWDPIF